jgi:hypothetical protein
MLHAHYNKKLFEKKITTRNCLRKKLQQEQTTKPFNPKQVGVG